jgi:hypothetical protein
MTLAQFHAAASEFYEGALGPADFVARLGGSPTPTSRFTYYQRLVEADVLRILGHLFPVTRALLGGERAPAWVSTVRAFRAARPCTHWDLNQWGQPFAAWLDERTEVPAGTAQLADHEWTGFSVNTHPSEWDGLAGVNPTLQVTHYTHQVAQCAAQHRKSPTAVPGLVPGEVTLMLLRDPVHLGLRVVQPTLGMLMVLALARNEVEPAWVERSGLSPAQLADARSELVRLGALGRDLAGGPA